MLTTKDWHYASEFGIVKTDRADILLESDQYNERRFLTGIGANAPREIVDGANRPVDEAFVDPDILRQHNPGTKQQGDLLVEIAGVCSIHLAGLWTSIVSDNLITGSLQTLEVGQVIVVDLAIARINTEGIVERLDLLKR